MSSQAPEVSDGLLSVKADSFAFGLVILETVTGLPVILTSAAREIPHTMAKTLKLLWFEELVDAPPTTLDGWSDVRWQELALKILHAVIKSCLHRQRQDRSRIADVTLLLEQVYDLRHGGAGDEAEQYFSLV